MAYDADRVVKQLGSRIAHLRRARGFSQGTFAERLRTSPQWISQIERGTRSPTVHTLVKIANALNISLADLFDAPPSATRVSKRRGSDQG